LGRVWALSSALASQSEILLQRFELVQLHRLFLFLKQKSRASKFSETEQTQYLILLVGGIGLRIGVGAIWSSLHDNNFRTLRWIWWS
jgi:hypothetical protein